MKANLTRNALIYDLENICNALQSLCMSHEHYEIIQKQAAVNEALSIILYNLRTSQGVIK